MGHLPIAETFPGNGRSQRYLAQLEAAPNNAMVGLRTPIRGAPLNAGVFAAELKQRNVLRAGAVYAALACALVQGPAPPGMTVGASDAVTRRVFIAAIIGFSFGLAFAWFDGFIAGSLRRGRKIAAVESMAHSTGRPLEVWIIGIRCRALVLLAANPFVLRRATNDSANDPTARAIAATLAKALAKFVAELTMVNEGVDANRQYFFDGLSEERVFALHCDPRFAALRAELVLPLPVGDIKP